MIEPTDSTSSSYQTNMKMNNKQSANILLLVLAISFIGASMVSAKVKTLRRIKAGSITSRYLHNRAVTEKKIENSAVTSSKLKTGSVTESKIAYNSVTSGKISDGNVNTDDLADNAVTTGKISDGTITANDILDGTITAAKMASGVLSGDGSGSSAWGSITGTLSGQTDLQSALDDKADKLEITVGDEGYGSTFAEAVTAISSTQATLIVPSGTHEGGGVTVPVNVTLKVFRGALLHEADGTILAINGSLEAGLYQVFSWTGSGKVAFSRQAVKEVLPQWWGAKGDGSNDDTASLNAAEEATVSGGVIHLLPGVYKTSGWLVTKTISIVSDTPVAYGSSSVTTIKAAGAQSYVLKFEGVYDGNTGDASGMLHPFLRNINIDGDNKAISDAAFIMENCNFARVENCSFQNSNGHGVRLRTNWEIRFTDFWLNNCGTVDTGSAFFVDGPSPFDAAYGTNNLRIIGGTWSSNRGRWIDVSSLANLDATWIEGNKFELDNATTPNTANTDVIYLGAASRTMITNNNFAGFGMTSDKYANLIYIGGSVSDPAQRGTPTNRVWGNRALAYNPTSGAINGLYLDTYAPTVEEGENTFVGSNGEVCPNVNVSQYPQLINLSWRNQSTSLFPGNPLPDRELPGFISIHKLARESTAKPFVADSNCVNDSQTVLSLDTPSNSLANIFHLLDLSRYVGYNATNLVVRVRMRLDSSDNTATVALNLSDSWNPQEVSSISTSWAWYSFTFSLANITQANHLLDAFYESGTPALLIDGIEFSTN